MKILKKLFGRKAKGFNTASPQQPKPDTSYLDALIRHDSAGLVSFFQITPAQGDPIIVPVSTGLWGIKLSPDELKRRIHDAIQEFEQCGLTKHVEVQEGQPLQVIDLGTFSKSPAPNPAPNKASDIAGTKPQSLPEPQGLAGYQ